MFEAFEDGSTVVEVVQELGIDPDRAEALERQHGRLSDRVVMTEAELDELRESIREEVIQEYRKKLRGNRQEDQQRIRELRQENSRLAAEIEQLHASIDAEVAEVADASREQGLVDGREEMADEYEERLAELEAGFQEQLAALANEYEERLAEVVAERDEALEKLALFQGGDEPRIWADGYESGTFRGAKDAAGQGKLEGFVLAAEHLGGNGAPSSSRSPGVNAPETTIPGADMGGQ